MAPSITLTTRTLGSYSGVSRVALDLALALSRSASSLAIRAWVPHALPSAIDGLPLGPCRLLQLPLRELGLEVLGGEAPPRSLIEHARISLAQRLGAITLGRAPAELPAATLEVVNGLGAHALYRHARAWQARAETAASRSSVARGSAGDGAPRPRSVIVVHESPRHFERFDAAGFDRRESPRLVGLPLAAAGRPRLDASAAIAALRSYDYRVFVSDECRREWNGLASLPEAFSLYIPNCASEQRAELARARERLELRQAFGYARDAVQLICVGALMPRKGQDLLLAALRALPDLNLHVDFCGAFSGGWAKRLAAEAASGPLRSRVRFLGAMPDVYERIYAADAFVLPSRAEAFPLVVLEAMALGSCVVAAAVDGVTEQVVDGQTGLLFPGQDVPALAKALRSVAADAPRRAALGEAGRERYLDKFQRAHQLARWSQAIASMV